MSRIQKLFHSYVSNSKIISLICLKFKNYFTHMSQIQNYFTHMSQIQNLFHLYVSNSTHMSQIQKLFHLYVSNSKVISLICLKFKNYFTHMSQIQKLFHSYVSNSKIISLICNYFTYLLFTLSSTNVAQIICYAEGPEVIKNIYAQFN